MLDQLFSRSRTADTGVGSVHGDGSSDLPISNCISGELGGVGMSIGYCTSSSPSVPTIITIVTPAKPIYEDFLSDSLISVVPTRSEPEEGASSTQTSTRTFTASGFLAAIFGIGIALSFWTPKNLWVFMGGFGFRREKRRQKNRQQQQRAVEAAEEVAVEGNKLTNGQKNKGKARAIHNETEEGESSTSTSTSGERTALLIGGPATYSSGLGLNPRDSGIDLTNGEETKATRPEKIVIHPEPTREPEPELTESEMLKTIDEEEEIELPINESWTFADQQPSPVPSPPRIKSPAPPIELDSPVIPPRAKPPVFRPAVEPETRGNDASYFFDRSLSVTLPTPAVIDTPVTNGYGPKQPGSNFSLGKSTAFVEVESPVSEPILKLNEVERRVEEVREVQVKLQEKVEEKVREKVEEFQAGSSVSTEMDVLKAQVEVPKVEAEIPKVEAQIPKVEAEVPKVEEVVIPVVVEVETPIVKEVEIPKVEHVEAPKTVETPKVKEVETPKVKEVEIPKVEPIEAPKVELVETPKVEPVELPKVESVEVPKVEPKVELVETPEVESVESPKVELVEAPKIEIPEPKEVEIPKVEVPKAEVVVEVPQVKKPEVAKSTPSALTVPSAPQIELIPPTPAFNSSFSEEAEEFSKERAEEEAKPPTLPDVEEEEELTVPTKAPVKSNSLTVEYNDKEDDDLSIVDLPISHSPDQISLSGDDHKDEEPVVESGLTVDDIIRPGSSKPPSTLGDDKSTKSGRKGFRRMASMGRERTPSVDSAKKDKLLRRSLTGFTSKKSKKDGGSAASSQVKLGELTPPPTPPETSQDAARPQSRRSEKGGRSMSWSNAASKMISKEKRDQAKKHSDSEAAGGADANHTGDDVETTESLKPSNESTMTNDRPPTADGKSKIPRGTGWFSKKKSSSNLSISDVSRAASLAAAKHEEVVQPTTETVAPLDKGKGIERTPVEEAPKSVEPIKVIEAPPPPSTEEEQAPSSEVAESIASVVPASDRPKPPRLKSVISVMGWGRKKK